MKLHQCVWEIHCWIKGYNYQSKPVNSCLLLVYLVGFFLLFLIILDIYFWKFWRVHHIYCVFYNYVSLVQNSTWKLQTLHFVLKWVHDKYIFPLSIVLHNNNFHLSYAWNSSGSCICPQSLLPTFFSRVCPTEDYFFIYLVFLLDSVCSIGYLQPAIL